MKLKLLLILFLLAIPSGVSSQNTYRPIRTPSIRFDDGSNLTRDDKERLNMWIAGQKIHTWEFTGGFILTEGADFILQEDASKIILE